MHLVNKNQNFGGGPDGASYFKPLKYLNMIPYIHKNVSGIKLPQKDSNTSILIYSIKKTFLMNDFALIS